MSTAMASGRVGGFRVTAMCLALLLSACGSGSGDMLRGAGDTGSTATSLQLQTAGGASVETVPTATKVDFSQLVDLSEVLSAAQIPAAEYVSATLTLDYSGATITADDGTAAAVALSPVDSNNSPLTGAVTVTVSVQLDNANHLVITPGRTGRLAFDFNLAASNTVNLTAGTVTVSPTLVATVVPSDTKQVRVRASLHQHWSGAIGSDHVGRPPTITAAAGQYDSAANGFAATRMAVVLNN
jgi:hypothetical protein